LGGQLCPSNGDCTAGYRRQEGPTGTDKTGWPTTVEDKAGQADPDAQFFVSVARHEKKGSDVNVSAITRRTL
jgi:hypothetical protein